MGNYSRRLPFALKGLDVVIFTVFQRFRLNVSFRPVLDQVRKEDERWMEDYHRDDESEGGHGKARGHIVGTKLHKIRMTQDDDGDDPNGMQEVR